MRNPNTLKGFKELFDHHGLAGHARFFSGKAHDMALNGLRDGRLHLCWIFFIHFIVQMTDQPVVATAVAIVATGRNINGV